MNLQDVNTGHVLHVLSLITSGLAIIAWAVFTRYFLRQNPLRKRRYLMMLVWLSVTLVFWLISATLRLFFGYRSPSIPMTLFRIVIDLNGFLGIIFVFTLRLRAWQKTG